MCLTERALRKIRFLARKQDMCEPAVLCDICFKLRCPNSLKLTDAQFVTGIISMFVTYAFVPFTLPIFITYSLSTGLGSGGGIKYLCVFKWRAPRATMSAWSLMGTPQQSRTQQKQILTFYLSRIECLVTIFTTTGWSPFNVERACKQDFEYKLKKFCHKNNFHFGIRVAVQRYLNDSLKCLHTGTLNEKLSQTSKKLLSGRVFLFDRFRMTFGFYSFPGRDATENCRVGWTASPGIELRCMLQR